MVKMVNTKFEISIFVDSRDFQFVKKYPNIKKVSWQFTDKGTGNATYWGASLFWTRSIDFIKAFQSVKVKMVPIFISGYFDV